MKVLPDIAKHPLRGKTIATWEPLVESYNPEKGYTERCEGWLSFSVLTLLTAYSGDLSLHSLYNKESVGRHHHFLELTWAVDVRF